MSKRNRTARAAASRMARKNLAPAGSACSSSYWATIERSARSAKARRPSKDCSPAKEHVQPVVLRDSEALCKKSRQCKVQTPLFAYTGRGNMIRL